MIKKQVTQYTRRARNIIWNAAGRYDFEPLFMAFFPNGTPDHYFNMVAGLVEKWLDPEKIRSFFEEYEDDHRAEEFDEFLWLGLENCVYEKEIPSRPILEQLRRERAERFYAEQASLSRQQMEYQSMPVYTQQEARWAAVCGKRAPVMTPREKRMAEALLFSGTLNTDGVLQAMAGFLETFFRYRKGEALPGGRKAKAGLFSRLFLPHEHERRDHFLVRTGTGEGDHPRAVNLGHKGLGGYKGPTAEDEIWIRTVFGDCSLPERDMRVLENDLCVGPDEDCRLWVVRGAEARDGRSGAGQEGQEGRTVQKTPGGRALKEAREVRAAREKQKKRNEDFFRDNAAVFRASEKALTTRLETILTSYMRPLPEPARAGRICPEKAYRLPVLQDGKVFLKPGDETEQEFFVDLLLDASQSRMNSQEVLAAEACVVAGSLNSLHIPVRVTAFRSVRGHTVLEVLKGAAEADCRGILRYYAGGWNRDALAIRALGHLEDDPALEGKQRIFLIMTDASPNDSTPAAAAGLRLPGEYEGSLAVRAAEEAVRDLRERNIRVGAVFHGNPSHLGDLNQIYGHANVRIRRAAQLAQGISDLLLLLLREINND